MKIRQFIKSLFSLRVHISWLITLGCIGLVTGVGLSALSSGSNFANGIWLAFGISLFLVASISRLRIMLVVALIAGASLGLWRGTLTRVDLTDYQKYISQEVHLVGEIYADPDIEQGIVKIRLSNVEAISVVEYDGLQGKVDKLDDYYERLPGQVWASLSGVTENLKRSDHVEIVGKLKSGFGSFPAAMSYGRMEKVERSPDSDPLRDLRDSFGEKLRSVISAPASDLGMGILAGQKTSLPADLSAAFIVASLTHIVVASGYNLTILVRFARRLFSKISRFAALALAGWLVFIFAAMVGFSPSMTRAGLVAGLSLLAWYYGRKFHPLTLLSVVAAITVMANPTSVWGDAGWYLSFLSFAGVIMLAPLLNDYFFGDRKPDKNEKQSPLASLRQVVIETFSAQLMAAPVIALFMGQFSVYGLLANILVLPILPLAMLLTFVAGVGAFVLPLWLAQILAQPAEWMLDYIILVANKVSELPLASSQIEISVFYGSIIYLVILLVMLYLKRKTKHNFRDDNVVE